MHSGVFLQNDAQKTPRAHKKEREETDMKKFGAFLLAGVLAIGTLTGCGSTDKKAEGSTGSTDSKVIKVAASATPHAEILEEAKPLLEKEGYDLEVTVFDDYVPVSYTHLTLPTKSS